MPLIINNNFRYVSVYLLTAKEFFLSVFLTYFVCFFIPELVLNKILLTILSLFTKIPMTMISFIVTNFSTMVFIAILGMIKKETVSFFVILNGLAMGAVAYYYRGAFVQFLSLIFPHAFFETLLIIVYCSHVKELSQACQEKNIEQIRINIFIVIVVCIPLLVLSAFFEAYKF